MVNKKEEEDMAEDKPGLGDMAGMLKQLRQMQKDLEQAQKELQKATVSAEAADGAIKITVTGDQRITALEIADDLLASGDAAELSRLLQAAFNDALEQSRQMAKERLGPMATSLNV